LLFTSWQVIKSSKIEKMSLDCDQQVIMQSHRQKHKMILT
jgi:hypothetical protein